MSDKFLHGVEVLEIDTGPRPIQTVRSSVVGIVGTAPGSAAAVAAALVIGSGTSTVTITADAAGVGGNSITMTVVKPSANSQTLSVAVTGNNITVNLATDSGGNATSTAAQVVAAINASASAAALVTAAGSGTGLVAALAKTPLDGGVDEPFPLNTPVMIAGSAAQAAKLGSTGTLPDALDSILGQIGAVIVVVRVAEGANETATLANVVGGTNSLTGNYEGVHALKGAESKLGVRPRILLAPGWTHQGGSSANVVVAELKGIADQLRAIILADAPNTTDTAAITYKGLNAGMRVFVLDPGPTKGVTNTPAWASPVWAGLLAKQDNNRGFWWSPSNMEINGITGTTRPVDFTLGDANCRANVLNENAINVIINQDGYRSWGNRLSGADPKWMFISVRRTADIINDSILRAHLWAVDRNITKTYIQDVVDGVNAYLRDLKALGAIINGTCWADPDLNTPSAIAQGKVYFNFDFTPPYPAEHITFRSMLTNDYLVELFD